MANGEGMTGTTKAVTTVGGISIVVFVGWLVLIGSYKSKVDETWRGLEDIKPRVRAVEVGGAEIRGDFRTLQAQTQQMFGELIRRQDETVAKLDRLIEK